MSRRRRKPAPDSSPPEARVPAHSALKDAAAPAAGSSVAWSRADGLALAFALAAILLAFRSIVGHGFLNWDDPQALVRNEALDGPGVVRWALTTTHMSHYQPLSWLAWAALRQGIGASAAVHHGASLLLHVVNTALVFLLTLRLSSPVLSASPRRVAALAAAIAFGLHPLRVEPVAWASALPYLLTLAFLMASALAYLAYADPPPDEVPTRGLRRALILSVILYAASLLSRPAAPAFPLVLLVLDEWRGRARRGGWRPLLLEKLPFAVLAVLATLAEAGARRFAPLEQAGLGVRLADAMTAPFVYLGRTLWPVGLSPLHALPLDPQVAWPVLLVGSVVLATLTTLALRFRSRRPGLALAWMAYLLLLAPAAGLTPSGVQATADRYTYLPGTVLAMVAGAALAQAFSHHRTAVSVLGTALAAILALLTPRQVGFWRDSEALWTRALALDPRNDVAAYNLALALEEQGEHLAAEDRYRQLLAMVPDHGPARHNLRLLEAARLEREGGAAAAAGRLEEAVARYAEALARDPARLHSRRSRGMVLAQLGRYEEAIPDLTAAARAPDAEAAVAGALAFALDETGRREEAVRVLREALSRYPRDPGLLASLAALEKDAARRPGRK